MSSQFDSLLDFGDDPPPSTNGTNGQQQANGDDFDPFGPGPVDTGKGSGDPGLLLDFSMSAETTSKNGTAANSDPFDSQFSLSADTNNADLTQTTTTSDSANPFSDMSSSEAQSSSANPLYDLMDDDFGQGKAPAAAEAEASSANPLYDLSHREETIETVTTTMAQQEEQEVGSSSANPLYDFMDAAEPSTHHNHAQSSDPFGMGLDDPAPAPEPAPQSDSLFEPEPEPEVMAGAAAVEEEEEEEQQEEEENVELFIREEGEDQTPAEAEVEAESSQQVAAPIPTVQVDEVEQQQPEEEEEEVEQQQEVVEPERARSPSPSQHSISSEGEVINEEEDMRQEIERERQAEDRQETPPRQEAVVTGAAPVEEDTHMKDLQAMTKQQTPSPASRSREATPQWEEEQEEGVYENEPEQRSDVVRESDRNIGAELPSVGTAKSLKDKFASGKVENAGSVSKKETSPPPAMTDGGVFENQPQYNPDVVHAGDAGEEAMPETGTARNMAARFKEMEKAGAPVPSPGRREITPDRTGKVEYVSEPRSHVEKYEPEVQAGIFESKPTQREDVVKSDDLAEEVLPEKGSAKNMAARFKQMSTEKADTTPRGKRQLTPDTSGRVEFVSEPTGFVEKYEAKTESGVFESQPANREDVVKSDTPADEIMPETGMARNIAARFKEMEKTTKSPPSPGKVKEFTPPRETETQKSPSSGVYESTPQQARDVVHADDQVEEVLPEKGSARSIADRFRQLSSGDNTPSKSPRSKKEFTPPPDRSGVYENTPKQFVPDYNKPAESGILESKPEHRDDVVRADEPPSSEQELPERGYTKNLLSAWRQKESESSKVSPPSSGKPKEFTPPREEPRVAQQRPAPRTPKSPMAGSDMNDGSVHPSDLPGQYQPQAEASVFESDPDVREDVTREADTDWTQGMPKPDTTKKMLAKFKNIQQQASSNGSSPSNSPAKPKPAARKEEEDTQSSPEKVGRSKSMRVAVQLEKCGACQKTVYAMEKIEIEKQSYHKSCFRCSHCHCILTPKTFAINNSVMFCTNHYKQMFATKGNYDEGFGRDQHKKRWKSEPNLADDDHSGSNSTQH